MKTVALERGRSIRSATADDALELRALLAAAVPDISRHTVWEVPWTWQHYLVVTDTAGEIIAAGSLQPLGHGKSEIRGVVVSDAARGGKLGRRLVLLLVERARSCGLDAVCMTREPGFFRKFGFENSAPTWVDCRRQPATSRPSPPRFAMALLPERVAC